MPLEIERKYLVCGEGWKDRVQCTQRQRQGYLSRTARGSVRVRRAGPFAAIAVKGPRRGIVRDEFEYPIPAAHAEDMLRRLCVKPLIEKTRHWVADAGMVWQVDVYGAEAEGLVLAEIELEHPEQAYLLPGWVGCEVTHDTRYRNWAIALGSWRGVELPTAEQPLAAEPRSWAHTL